MTARFDSQTADSATRAESISGVETVIATGSDETPAAAKRSPVTFSFLRLINDMRILHAAIIAQRKAVAGDGRISGAIVNC